MLNSLCLNFPALDRFFSSIRLRFFSLDQLGRTLQVIERWSFQKAWQRIGFIEAVRLRSSLWTAQALIQAEIDRRADRRWF